MTTERVCIADKVLLYMRYGFDKLKSNDDWDIQRPIALDYAERFCKLIRGDPMILNGRNPKAIAAAIIWISSIKTGSYITQRDIKRALNINIQAIRIHAHRLNYLTNEILTLT